MGMIAKRSPWSTANVAADVPRAGNLVRIKYDPGHIADENGNTAGPGLA